MGGRGGSGKGVVVLSVVFIVVVVVNVVDDDLIISEEEKHEIQEVLKVCDFLSSLFKHHPVLPNMCVLTSFF